MGLFSRAKERQTLSPEIERKAFLEMIHGLMKNPDFLLEAAMACDSGYKKREIEKAQKSGQEPESWLQEPLFTTQQIQALRTPLVPSQLLARFATGESLLPFELDQLSYELQEKQLYESAILLRGKNLAGFNAIQEGLGILTDEYDGKELLLRIVADRLSVEQKELFCRLAHSTWLQTQLDTGRDQRPVVKPFDLLPENEKNKDWAQIQDTARVMLKYL
jgi:hypothetical protein